MLSSSYNLSFHLILRVVYKLSYIKLASELKLLVLLLRIIFTVHPTELFTAFITIHNTATRTNPTPLPELLLLLTVVTVHHPPVTVHCLLVIHLFLLLPTSPLQPLFNNQKKLKSSRSFCCLLSTTAVVIVHSPPLHPHTLTATIHCWKSTVHCLEATVHGQKTLFIHCSSVRTVHCFPSSTVHPCFVESKG